MEAAGIINESNVYSNVVPIKKFILLGLATFGLYYIYWYFKNWQLISIATNKRHSAIWRTIGLLIPILAEILVYKQFRHIIDLSKSTGYQKALSPFWRMVSFCVLMSPALFPIVYLIFLIPVGEIQKCFNYYWSASEVDKPIKISFSPEETFALVIGGMSWLLIFAGVVKKYYL